MSCLDKSTGFAFSCDGIDFYNGWNGGYYGELTYLGKNRLVGVSNPEVLTNGHGDKGLEACARYHIYKTKMKIEAEM